MSMIAAEGGMMMSTTIRVGNEKQTGRWPAWPLGITIFLILFVLSLVGFLLFAGTQKVELVTDNYYAKTLQYQDQIDRINRTRALPEPVLLRYEAGTQVYRVKFPAMFEPGEIQGSFTLYRPNDEGADVTHRLRLDEAGEQTFSTAGLSRGLWRVRLTWSAAGEEYFNEAMFVID